MRGWGISSFSAESLSNPSVSSSMPNPTLCCAVPSVPELGASWASVPRKSTFLFHRGGGRRGSLECLLFPPPHALVPDTLLCSLASCGLPIMGPLASAVSALLSHLSLIHPLFIFQRVLTSLICRCFYSCSLCPCGL